MVSSLIKLEAMAEKRHNQQLSPELIGDLLRLADLCVITIVGVSVYLFYVYPGQGEISIRYFASILGGVVISASLFQWFGVYAEDYIFSRRLRIIRALSAWAHTFALLLAIAFALKISSFYSRVWAVTWFFTTCGVLAVGRLVLSNLFAQWAREGRFALRSVILGAGEQGLRLAAHFKRDGDVHTRVIGFIDDRKTRIELRGRDCELLGDTDTLVRLIRQNLVDQVFIALPWTAETRLWELVQKLAVTPVRIRLAPDLVGFQFADRAFTRVANIPMLQIFDRPISGRSFLAKIIEDWVLGTLFLLFLGPLMLLIALAIKLDSPGPVFFKQKRRGFNDQLIEVWKFRTMHTKMEDPHCDVQTTKSDPRITRIGRFLRRWSLDELPQLFNVLSGDMSIVGPRPHALGTKAQGQLFWEVVDRYAARHRVKPGITGWAQVNGWRGETDTIEKIRNRVDHDFYYIDNWSIRLDLLIIARTAFVLLRDRNAY